MKDVILIGGGIMSANLGAMLKRLAPALTISLYEVADKFAQEATKGWNNAGTGHAGICELYFTPDVSDNGEVDVSKAISVFTQFEQTLQFWSYAVREGMIDEPEDFIKAIPHMSFVQTQEQADYLKMRFQRMSQHHFFDGMEYTSDPEMIKSWAPLLLEGRQDGVPIAATRMDAGTEIDFGCVSIKLIEWLSNQTGCSAHTNHRVLDLNEIQDGWSVKIENQKTGEVFDEQARFVFVGAGGGSLPLLQKSGIKECKTYGGFPIGGQWLVCKNPEIVNKHHAKVYGQQNVGNTPATALPHLDTRVINGERSILFGPFAAATSQFTKHSGSCLDLPMSLRGHNIATLIKAGLRNIPVIKYLLQQSTQGMESRMKTLRSFYPDAKSEDWELVDAGIRVQVIKKMNGKSVVHYDTELISNSSGTIAALLGASPGASISVSIMLEVIQKCQPQLLESREAKERLEAMLPCHNTDISAPDNADYFRKISREAARYLQLAWCQRSS